MNSRDRAHWQALQFTVSQLNYSDDILNVASEFLAMEEELSQLKKDNAELLETLEGVCCVDKAIHEQAEQFAHSMFGPTTLKCLQCGKFAHYSLMADENFCSSCLKK